MLDILRKGKKVESAVDTLNRMLEEIPSGFSVDVNIRLRDLKNRINKFLSSNAKDSEKNEKAKAISDKLSPLLLASRYSGRPISEADINAFITDAENIINPTTIDIGDLGRIMQNIRSGKYDTILSSQRERDTVLDLLSRCFNEISRADLSAERKTELDKAIKSLGTALFANSSVNAVNAAIDRINDTLQITAYGGDDQKLQDIYAIKIQSVSDFCSNAESIANRLDAERTIANRAAEAQQKLLEELAMKIHKLKTTGRMQEAQKLMQEFANAKTKRNGETNRGNILNGQFMGIGELDRKIRFILDSGESIEEIEPLFMDTTYGAVLTKDYTIINDELDKIIKRIRDRGVPVVTPIYDELYNSIASSSNNVYDMPIDPELQAMMDNYDKMSSIDNFSVESNENANSINN